MRLCFVASFIIVLIVALVSLGCFQHGECHGYDHIHALRLEKDVYNSKSLCDALNRTLVFTGYLKSCISTSSRDNSNSSEARESYAIAIVFHVSIHACMEDWSNSARCKAFYDDIISQLDALGLDFDVCWMIDNATKMVDNRQYTFAWIDENIQSIADRNLLFLKAVAECGPTGQPSQ